MRVGKYQVTTTIGQGTFGKVKLGIDHSTGNEFAVKIMNKSEIQERELTTNVRREIGIMKQLNHKNIVRLHEVLSSSRKIYMVMDLVRGGELFRHMETYGEHGDAAVRKYFQQMIDGLEYCHRRGVCHRDLKPENLLVDENGVLKVTDFGVSAVIKTSADGDNKVLHTACGTPYYCAPEILSSPGEGYDGIKIDSWSAGVILYRMLVGVLPFQGSNLRQLVTALERGNVRYPASIGPDATDLLKKLLEKYPARRWRLSDVRKHPWFLKDYELNRQKLGSIARSSDLSSAMGDIPRELSRKSDSTEDVGQANGHGHQHGSGRLSSVTPPDVGRANHNSDGFAGRGSLGSSIDDLRPGNSGNAPISLSKASSMHSGQNGSTLARRQESTVLAAAIDESGGDLAVFVERLLPATKVKRVPELVQKLQDIGCDNVEDLKIIVDVSKTHEEFVTWLERKAQIQPVIALWLANAFYVIQ